MEFINDPKNFDQHFLIDKEIINYFIDIANITKNDEVVEVGPGEGVLTTLIAAKAKKLTCIELDERLRPCLEKISNKYKNIDLVFGNALDIYIPKCNKIITSLPYRIIEPFITKLLKCEFNEVYMITGDKYAAGIINHEINKLSLLTNCFFKTTKYKEILPSSFKPSPRVKSAIIKLEPINYKDISDDNILIFRLMFNLREKKVRNCLIESLIKYYDMNDRNLTQRMSKELINDLNLPSNILDKTFETCSNEDLKELNKKIEYIKIKR